MTLEEQEGNPAAVSEQADPTQEQNQEEQKTVPLAAMMAEKKRRQEETRLRYEAEARNKVLEEMIAQKAQPEEEEDPEALVTKGSFKQEKAMTKREILEQVYQDMNPEAVQKINTYLKPILDKKPWLAASVDNALNRLARANEIVNDYLHLVEEKPSSKVVSDAKRIVENSQKPRSPVEVGKSAQPTGTEYLKSIQGKKEFREYRQKVLRGEA
jgi:hypothetical protein